MKDSTASLAPDARAIARLDVLVPQLADVEKQIAALQARKARLLAQADEVATQWADAGRSCSDADFAHRTVAAEIAALWRVSDRTVQHHLDDATTLVTRFPATLASLAAGKISRFHAKIIADAGARIERPEMRAEFEDAILPYAEAESASRLTPVAKRRAEWFLETTIAERHAVARAKRRVAVVDLDDGMAEVSFVTDAVLAHGVYDRVSQMARDVSEAEKHTAATIENDSDAPADCESGAEPMVTPRTLDQIRVDLLVDLLLASDPVGHVGTTDTGLGAIRATVQVTVPVLTLLDDRVADPFEAVTLGGFGPIDADTARSLAATAPGWDRILTHPISGAVLGVDRYQPSKEMRRHLQVRDQHCRFPGCRMSTRRSDADHTIDFQFGGPTEVSNLAHLCRTTPHAETSDPVVSGAETWRRSRVDEPDGTGLPGSSQQRRPLLHRRRIRPRTLLTGPDDTAAQATLARYGGVSAPSRDHRRRG